MTAALGPDLLNLPVPPEIDLDGGASLLAWLRHKREEQPVWRDPSGNVHVFRHADVMRILADPAGFSSDTMGRLSGGENPAPGGTLLLLDPPRHGVMRRLVSKVFTPRMIESLTPRISAVIAGLLDDLAGRDTFDLVEDIANPFPVIVISSMLGVPAQDRPLFQNWADGLLSIDYSTAEGLAKLGQIQVELGGYLGEHVKQRREREHDDLIGQLVKAEVDGEKLTDVDVISFSALLLLAGHVTTAVLLSNMMLELDADPAVLQRVREDRSAIPAFTEEVLRHRPSFLKVERLPTGPVELGGLELAENTMTYLWLISANRDDAVFPGPDGFDLDRPNSRQIAFGHGIHHCLGAPLARLEARLALNLILDRFSELRIDRSGPLAYHSNQVNVFGPKRLPLLVSRS